MTDMTGGCACGRVRYAVTIEDNDAYLCHCRMCQRATGGVSVAYKNLPKAAIRWEREPDFFNSSPIARRGFCSSCGTRLTFEFLEGDVMDLTVGSFDEPGGFTPRYHFGVEGVHRAWLNTEGLPEKKTTDYQPLVERWVEAVGKVPD